MYQRDKEVARGLTKQISQPSRNLHSRRQTGFEAVETEAALVPHYITLRHSRPTRMAIQVSKLERWDDECLSSIQIVHVDVSITCSPQGEVAHSKTQADIWGQTGSEQVSEGGISLELTFQ